MSGSKSTLQVLREAKYLLINKGWAQGSFGFEEDEATVASMTKGEKECAYTPGPEDCKCFCTLGAVSVAAGNHTWSAWDHPAELALRDAVLRRDNVTNREGFIPTYNDAPGRTKEEILSLFDDAIDMYKLHPGKYSNASAYAQWRTPV